MTQTEMSNYGSGEHTVSIKDAIEEARQCVADALGVKTAQVNFVWWDWPESPACGLRLTAIEVSSEMTSQGSYGMSAWSAYNALSAPLLFFVERLVIERLLGSDDGGDVGTYHYLITDFLRD